jgi:hypothetical protein
MGLSLGLKISCSKIFMDFLMSSGQMLEWCLETDHDHFLLHHSQIIIHSHLSFRHYTIYAIKNLQIYNLKKMPNLKNIHSQSDTRGEQKQSSRLIKARYQMNACLYSVELRWTIHLKQGHLFFLEHRSCLYSVGLCDKVTEWKYMCSGPSACSVPR